jgi:outer membrane protein OmpA-like peptidoglycan-associated protein
MTRASRTREVPEARPRGAPRAEPEQAAGVLLALQRGAGNAAVARLLARAPAPSVESPGHEEASWAQPSPTMASDPVHVATIHFRTKEWTLDAKDEAVIKALAEAYAPYAARNRFRPKEPQGLRGRIVGYADPRRSDGPDNQTLSANRAHTTWRLLLRHLVMESGVATGHFDLEQVAGGVAPEAAGADAGAPAAEGNLHAPMRKAEIFLSGHGTAPAAEPSQQAEPPEDKRVPPPNLDDWNRDDWDDNGWDRFDPAIEAGRKREIEALALKIAGWTITEGNVIGEALFWTAGAAGVTFHEAIPVVRLAKPPWWDERDRELRPRVGRYGAVSAEQTLIYKAKLLKRDYIETAKWSEIHFSSVGSSYSLLLAEAKKDNPDKGKIEQYVKDLGYLRFMIDDVQNSAQALAKLTQ